MYLETRKPLRPNFYSKADLRIGRQSIVNRAGDYINDLTFDWNLDISDDALRTNLKRHFNMTKLVT